MAVITQMVIFLQFIILASARGHLVSRINYEVLDGTTERAYVGDVRGDYASHNSIQLDTSINSTFIYSIWQDESTRGVSYFSIDSDDGQLWTDAVVDRDILCPGEATCCIPLDVMREEGQGLTRLFVKVNVTIIDLNDNAPTFPQKTMHLSISEASAPNTKFTLMLAYDPDSPMYGIQRYELVSSTGHFSLDASKDADAKYIDLRLKLVKKLDREQKERYQVTIKAIDGGYEKRVGTLHVNITVTDINDNSPVFDKPLYTETALENKAVRSVIARVRATDKDSGSNGRIQYSFERNRSEYDLFGIDTRTGDIYLIDHLDYETKETHFFTVTATDSGLTPLSDTAKVKIKVIDENDNPPEIDLHTEPRSPHIAHIYENERTGKTVLKLGISDPDSGPNGEYKCSLQGNAFKLKKIYKKEHEIVSLRVFDREEKSVYNISVQCRDFGTPEKTSSKSISVRILDKNDNAPNFKNYHYHATLKENNYVGADVLQVNAADPDKGQNSLVTYELSGNIGDWLQIGPESGKITAKAVFDYEMQVVYNFTVIARDHGRPSRTSTTNVSLTITDENDEAPKFKQNKYAFGVTENLPAGSPVGTLIAYDSDFAPHNRFTYRIECHPKGAGDAFRINENTGLITTAKVLDREQQSAYNLKAYAIDKGDPPLSSHVEVLVYVADANDNAPIIEFPSVSNNTVYVSAKTPKNQEVTRVSARDDDVGNNAKLAYHIMQQYNQDLFEINEYTGVICIVKNPEERMIQPRPPRHSLIITVKDHGSPMQSTSTELTIILDDSIPYVPKDAPKAVLRKRNLVILICVTSLASVVIISLLLTLICMRSRTPKPQYKYHVTMNTADPMDGLLGEKVGRRTELTPATWIEGTQTLGSWGRKSGSRSKVGSITSSRDNFAVIEHQSVCGDHHMSMERHRARYLLSGPTTTGYDVGAPESDSAEDDFQQSSSDGGNTTQAAIHSSGYSSVVRDDKTLTPGDCSRRYPASTPPSPARAKIPNDRMICDRQLPPHCGHKVLTPAECLDSCTIYENSTDRWRHAGMGVELAQRGS